MNNILALDQSSRLTGYAIYKDNQLTDFGKIDLNNPNLDIRLVELREQVDQLIEENDITTVVIEDIQLQNNVGNNVQTFKALAEVYGVISELLEEKKIPHSSILASSWKSVLGIKGKTRPEQKRNAQEYVLNTYNHKVIQDIADAICIGAAFIKVRS